MTVRVALVGERFNLGRAWRPRDPAREVDLRFLTRLGAFREGPGRERLRACGLRWDLSLNLLMPDRPGAWEAARAREVAAAIRDELLARADLVVLAGRRVATAFGVRGELPASASPFLAVPHPSGRSHWWNEGEPRRQAVREAFSRAEREAFRRAAGAT